MPITKPSVQRPWADTGTKTPPSDGRRNTGYVPNDIPTRAELNALLNEMTTLERYVMQVGISDWDTNETYVVGNAVRDTSDNRYYRLITTSGINPALAPHQQQANWAAFGVNLRANVGESANPIVAFTDPTSNFRRWGLDHEGFDGGQILAWDECWEKDSTQTFAADMRWVKSITGGTVGLQNAGTSGLAAPGFRQCIITPPNGSTTSTYSIANFRTFSPGADTLVSIQCPVALASVGSNSILAFFGLGNDGPLAATHGVFVFRASGASTNWFFMSADAGIGGAIDTGVAPTANVYQRMKIVLAGASASETGVARAHLLIDGVLRASINNPVAAASNIQTIFGANQQVPAGSPVSVGFGPVRYRQVIFPGDVF